MVRQYKIHTDLDGSENKTYDMTNGIIRFYEPNDLGISMSTNVWSNQGMGVLGNSSISHPNLNFKLETFGSDLKENYTIFNKFINDVISKKYVTLEYTNELGTFYADVTLDTVTKTEGYGFDGTFSETIGFIPVNMWYVYEQLKFSKVQNGEIDGNTKIYGNKETTVYPNLNLAPHTELLMDTNNNFIWGNKASATNTITYEKVSVPNQPRLVNGIHVTQTTTGQAGWRSPYYSQTTTASLPCSPNTKYTASAWIKNNATTGLHISLSLGVSAKVDQTSPKFLQTDITIPGDGAWHYITYTHTTNADSNYMWSYVYTVNGTTSADFSFVGYKLESGSVATPWMPSQSEVKSSDYRNYGSYKYDYTYYGEDNVERFSKWKIADGIFSFTARVVPSEVPTTPPTQSGRNDYGVRFLDKDFNEYTAIMFDSTTKPESIQFNTDVNDEYYLAQVGTTTVNVFSALNYQRFRTRLIQKGTMELINVDVVEMNVKRKVEFV